MAGVAHSGPRLLLFSGSGEFFPRPVIDRCPPNPSTVCCACGLKPEVPEGIGLRQPRRPQPGRYSVQQAVQQPYGRLVWLAMKPLSRP